LIANARWDSKSEIKLPSAPTHGYHYRYLLEYLETKEVGWVSSLEGFIAVQSGQKVETQINHCPAHYPKIQDDWIVPNAFL